MIRIRNSTVEIPNSVDVNLSNGVVVMKSCNGELVHNINKFVRVIRNDGFFEISLCNKDVSNNNKAMVGTTRALLISMIQGLTSGFIKKLHLVGVGYRALLENNIVVLFVGFSHSISYKLPSGIIGECPTSTEIIIKGIDKQLVGQVAADLRSYRRPEPFKGKGIRYFNEVISIKETKKR